MEPGRRLAAPFCSNGPGWLNRAFNYTQCHCIFYGILLYSIICTILRCTRKARSIIMCQGLYVYTPVRTISTYWTTCTRQSGSNSDPRSSVGPEAATWASLRIPRTLRRVGILSDNVQLRRLAAPSAAISSQYSTIKNYQRRHHSTSSRCSKSSSSSSRCALLVIYLAHARPAQMLSCYKPGRAT